MLRKNAQLQQTFLFNGVNFAQETAAIVGRVLGRNSLP